MSVEAVSAVLNFSASTGTSRNVVIAMANRADEHGLCFPSVKDIAKRANCSPRAVQYALRKLEELGELQVLEGGEGGRKRTPLYIIELPGLDGEVTEDHNYYLRRKGAKTAPPKTAQRAQAAQQKGASGGSERAQTSAPKQSVETSVEPSNKKTAASFSDPVAELYEFWKASTGRNGGTKLTDGRRRAVKARLAEGRSDEEIRRAIANVAASDWHMKRGRHADRDGEKHDDLTLICRNGELLEKYRDLASADSAPPIARGEITDEDAARRVWDKARELLRPSVPESTFVLWIEGFEAAGVRDGRLVLVDTRAAGGGNRVAWAGKRYTGLVQRALRDAGGEYSDVEFVDETQLEFEAA